MTMTLKEKVAAALEAHEDIIPEVSTVELRDLLDGNSVSYKSRYEKIFAELIELREKISALKAGVIGL